MNELNRKMVDHGQPHSSSPVKQKWVCPNDRMLALRARVSVGWSVKTHELNSYKSESPSLDEEEQETIRAVIKRAEDLENMEQQRVGRLVERLDNMKRNAVGTGLNQCILCGDNFGMLTSHGMICFDCKKNVCQKCGVETYSTIKKESVWRCKICAETREMWKKSGAWFFKGLPKYVLPPKKNTNIAGKYSLNRRPGLEKNNWSRASNLRSEEVEEESSSEEDRKTTTATTPTRSVDVESKERSSHLYSDSTEYESAAMKLIHRCSIGMKSPASIDSDEEKHGLISFKFDPSDGPEMMGSAHSLRRQSSDCQGKNLNYYGDHFDSISSQYPNFICNWQQSQCSLLTSNERYSNSDLCSLSAESMSSVSGPRTSRPTEEIFEIASDSIRNLQGNLGSVELSLVYDSLASSIHVYLHRAKNLKAMDINGLADPFCKLNILPVGVKSHRLRTRTVHKTKNPEFNETLTFYGVTESDLKRCALHIIVESEEAVWGEESWSHGRILITLCYSTRRKSLIVGVIKCANLAPMDNNGFSDPFVKLCLKPDALNQKFKTSVKWKNLNPTFNEEFAFETKMTDLAMQTLVLTVWDKDYGKSNDYLGCLELSCKSKGERLRHWIDMIKFPDHKHEGLHSLCELQPPPNSS
ncbi:rabphilin-3A [Nilaparvata lugens]|uniref:rabphilin-3A n=1 Tax=Nilaparvata lugens TaxID=108931 RepID=UPI00193D81B4|nr:rabphilin-3A [Nilaparvata lugens]